MNKGVGVLGAGAFGTAIAKIIAEKGIEVTLWSFEQDVADEINREHTNRYLPGVTLPETVRAVTDVKEAAEGREYIILSSPSLFILDTVKKITSVSNIMEGMSKIAVITKGFLDSDQGPQLLLDRIENYLPGFYKGNVVYISGPSHAEEVARGKITGLISACANPRMSILFRELLSGETVQVFSSLDVVGVQISAAVKNVVAIAFGLLDALKNISDRVGDNTESYLFAVGLNEIMKLGMAMGATHPETFTSLAAVGDLHVTCRSLYGRNRRFGAEIIDKKVLDQFKDIDDMIANIGKLGYLPEGIIAAKYAVRLAEKYGLKLPLIQSVYQMCNKDLNPLEVVKSLDPGFPADLQ
ncbi:NAD(P)H-dependent glycerol-3-phosphate dehydrogenase [Spirochaeta isovalerica]|uniref:Glycerol-3-phosphate dehydrogenase [NAD(P)+] n=1 Tax=Spirochaeta isovalerica TaxID=150 RepID=A0A841RCS6_9SPIO|nr:NAD(P)H-dependent glycerol-3-phosphate dehydrogenase [Spirochaeta isovalerica]MBB6480458.1 glycerol-3-phosphate dehydrogenase (NAD(P)+) [Spirochaeta isovalerica]